MSSGKPDPEGAGISLSELWVGQGARLRSALRWELSVFPAVTDVLATRDPGRVVVAHRGPAEREAWTEVLRSTGFDITPARLAGPMSVCPVRAGEPR